MNSNNFKFQAKGIFVFTDTGGGNIIFLNHIKLKIED